MKNITIFENAEILNDYFDMYIMDDETINNKFIICGNRNYKEFNTDNEEYKAAYDVLSDIDIAFINSDYSDVKEYMSFYHDELNSVQVDKLIEIYDNCSVIDDIETLLKAMNVISNGKYDISTICGYCQGDWNYIIYDTSAINAETVSYIESLYFGKISECYIENDSDDYWSVITHDALWKMNDAEILAHFDLDDDTEIIRK